MAGTPTPPPRPIIERRPGSKVLVVDSDAAARRSLQLTLGREPDLSVEEAVDGAGALEILAKVPVHLILAETDFGDMNGLQFFRRLSQETRLRSLPFVFLSADARVTTKTVAFNAGVDDYLVKPCDGLELVSRVRALIARQRRINSSLRTRGYALAGDFSGLSFPDLISILELGRKSGTISVASGDLMGSVYLDQGRVVHALFGNLMGASAFIWMMAREEGHFEFTPGPCAIEEGKRTIHGSAQSLMMESARVIDTERASGTHAAVQVADPNETRDPLPVVEAEVSAVRASAFIPERGAAAQIERAIRDPATLGNLMIFSREELTRWTAHASARERLHIVMVADLAQGVSAMLPLAGPPSERWVLRSMSPDAKAVGIAFFLRSERLIDLVLVDARDPGVFRPALRRTPSALIVAPPDGDALALGTKARVELTRLITDLVPRAALGLGNATLEAALRGMSAGFAEGAPVRCMAGALGEPPTDLRPLLADSVRLCAGLGSEAALRRI